MYQGLQSELIVFFIRFQTFFHIFSWNCLYFLILLTQANRITIFTVYTSCVFSLFGTRLFDIVAT